jgi:O-antigen/teichoic acid export membrane protein
MRLSKLLSSKSIQTGALYGTSSMFMSIATMVAGIVMIKWLEPEQIGLWQSLTVITAYTSFAQLGINQGLNRELPYHYGKGDVSKGNSLAETNQAYATFLSLFFLSITIIAVSVLLLFSKPYSLIAGVLTLGLVISLNTFNNFLVVTYRSAKAFNKLSIVYFTNGFLILLLLPFIYFFKYYGLLMYSFSSALFLNTLMFIFRPLKIKSSFKRIEVIHLIKTGFPIFVMGYLRNVARTSIRLTLLFKGGIKIVGLFSPVSAVYSVMSLFPNIFANYFYPQMTYRYGKTGDPKILWPIVVKTYLILFSISIPLVILIWCITPYVINTYFQKYSESIKAIQIMAISLSFGGAIITHNVFYSIKAYTYSYVYTAVELLLYGLVPIAMINVFSNILTSVSFSVLIINIITFSLNFALLRHALFNPKYVIIDDGK